MTDIPVKFTIFTPVPLDIGMHFDLEVKGLNCRYYILNYIVWMSGPNVHVLTYIFKQLLSI